MSIRPAVPNPLDCFRLRIRSARATRADCSDLTSANGLRRKAMPDDVGNREVETIGDLGHGRPVSGLNGRVVVSRVVR